MKRIVAKTKVGNDGNVHIFVGEGDAGAEVQITVEPIAVPGKAVLTARDLIDSGLVGMWANRTDIDESHEFARRLREQAQTRG